MLALGCAPGDRVALLAKNCAEWFISDLAMQMAGLISVPLYPLQSAESIAYVLEHAQCKVILVGKLDEPDKLATGIAPHITRIAMPYPSMPTAHDWHSLLARHAPLANPGEQQPDAAAVAGVHLRHHWQAQGRDALGPGHGLSAANGPARKCA